MPPSRLWQQRGHGRAVVAVGLGRLSQVITIVCVTAPYNTLSWYWLPVSE
jgi:hypothetical protein